MSEKVLQTRIQLKYDTLSNWNLHSDFKPKAGEICIVSVPSSSGAVKQEPAILFKVGDGSNTFATLPYTSAKAADVNDYALQANETFKQTIEGWVGNVVAQKVEDTNTKYQIISTSDNAGGFNYQLQSQEIGKGWVNATGLINVPKSYDDAALKASIEENTNAIKVLNGPGEGSVPKIVADAIAALNLATTYVKASDFDTFKKNNAAALNKKIDSVSAEDKSILTGGTATAPTIKVQIDGGAKNALKLVADGLRVDDAEYSIIKDVESGGNAAVYHLTKDGSNVGVPINIPKDLVVKSGKVVENPKGQIPGTYIELVLQNQEDKPLYVDVGKLIEYVTGGTAADGMITVAVDPATHIATATLNDGTITKTKLDSGVQTSLTKADNAATQTALGEEVERAKAAEKKNADAITALSGGGSGSISDTISTAIGGLNSSVSATAALGNQVSVLTGVTESAGKLTAKTEVKLAAIAKTGNVNDLIQTKNDVLVFDCGSATKNV